MRNKELHDTKHRVENALRKAKQQRGLDYIEWKVNDDDLDYILNHYNTVLLKYEIKRTFRRGFSVRGCKSNIVKEIYRRKGNIAYMGLTQEQVAECRNAGLEVTPRVYRISHRHTHVSGNTDKGRRSGRRNIGKTGRKR